MAVQVEPGSSIDFKRAMRFSFDDPNWVAKLLMGSLFYLLAVFLIGGFFLAGYMMELIRRSARGEQYPLPEWENLGDMFVEGATVMAAYVILIFPVMVLFIVPMIAISAFSEGGDPPAALGLVVVLLMLVLAVVYIALLLYFPAAMVRMAMERRFSAAFEFSENFEFLKRNIINFILAIVFYMVASLISQFGIILFCIGIIPAVFWAVSVGAYSLGEVALRDPARGVGVPLKILDTRKRSVVATQMPHPLHFAQSPQDDWQQILREAVRDIGELSTLLELPPSALVCPDSSTQNFPLLVPRGYLSRMRMGDPRDPLLLQVLPRAAESERTDGFGDDPLDELERSRRGLIQKYANRALLITTGACPVHCRYCFRRSFPYTKETASRSDWRPALATLAQSKKTKEIILSGGDPLSLSNRRLSDLLLRLDALPQIETVRIHTRFPIMIPERVDDGLVELITKNRFNVAIVIHANHAREIDGSVAAALSRLRASATALLNQSVLLRQVNDDSDTLCALSERLFECGVLPYYLHLLDPVSGTAHFEVDEGVGIELVKEMRANLPGYLVPTLVREIPGESSKTPIQ